MKIRWHTERGGDWRNNNWSPWRIQLKERACADASDNRDDIGGVRFCIQFSIINKDKP